MDIRSGHPFWLVKNGLIHHYPRLQAHQHCDVVIVGGGITGALITYRLAQTGLNVVLIDKRDIGCGSTSASTAMLQYEIDQDLHELKNLVGDAHATRAYQLGVEAIDCLEQWIAETKQDCGFVRVPSLYCARQRADLPNLKQEFLARQSAGFQVQYLDGAQTSKYYGLRALGSIVSSQGAQVDPLRLAQALLQTAQQMGAKIYDRTEAKRIHEDKKGIHVITTDGFDIHAQHIIYAAGYESQQYLPKPVASLHSTYALVTEVVDVETILQGRYLLWEAARPYFYLRTTSDSRIMMGGGDENFRDPAKRDRLVDKKSAQLMKLFYKFYPHAPKIAIDYAWAGTFGETEDGLAYIGKADENSQAYFALGYGGNGITYSVIAANILSDLIQGKPNADAEIFSFERNRKNAGNQS